jgi:hypothetical protein
MSSRIPDAAQPALKSMKRLKKLPKNSPEARAEARTLTARLKTLYRNNKKWFLVLAAAVVGGTSYAKRNAIAARYGTIKGQISATSKDNIRKMYTNAKATVTERASSAYGGAVSRLANAKARTTKRAGKLYRTIMGPRKPLITNYRNTFPKQQTAAEAYNKPIRGRYAVTF